jgi:sugar/nucleoside kinase (ribokinase family)
MSEHPDVLCAGIVVADHLCTPISHLPAAGELVTADRLILELGGCAANTAVDLCKMGVRSAVVGRVGGDVFGRVVADMLREKGVDTTSLTAHPGSDTSQTLIVNVAGQDRRFIHSFGANADFRADDIPHHLFGRAKVLYLGGYLIMPKVRPEELAETFAAARAAGMKTALDVVTPGPGAYMRQLEPVLPQTDVFLPNTDEALLISGERDPLRQAAFFRNHGAGTVVITCGGSGCVLVNAEQRLRAGTYPIEYVDATGGGDAFAAGFMYGLLRGMPTLDCLRVASALGASCVRAVGTTPGVFTRSECEQFLRSHTLAVERV